MLLYPPQRQQLRHWLIGLVFLLIWSSCTSAPPSQENHKSYPAPTPTPGVPLRPIIDTWNNIHVFQTFDYNISDPAGVANHYDFVWGASVKNVAAFHSGNPNIFISYYIPFHRDSGTFSDRKAYHNLAYWKSIHPDWILYRCDRITPAYYIGDLTIPFDFTNPAVVSWQVQTYAQPASARGYDGLAADNVDLVNRFGACGVYINGQWVQRYTGQVDDPQWRVGIITWATLMQQALHRLDLPMALIPNLDLSNLPFNDPQVQQMISHVDGVLDEAGFTYDGHGYLTGDSWMQKIQFIMRVQEQQKPYYIINQFYQPGPITSKEVQWALASYLMGKEHLAALFISPYQGYGAATWYSEYDALIGTPTSAMYQAQNVYFRNYSHGVSIVNPSATNTYIVTIDTGHAYMDLYGNAVSQTIAMPPHSGYVLLNLS